MCECGTFSILHYDCLHNFNIAYYIIFTPMLFYDF